MSVSNSVPSGATGGESSLSTWAGPYVTEMLGRGQALSEMPYSSYSGPLTAGASDLQTQAFQGLGSLQAPTSTFNPNTFTSGTWDSGVAAQYMNPYTTQAMQPAINEMQRQTELRRMQEAGRMTQAGSFGGSRQGIIESGINRDMIQQVGDMTATGNRDAYDRAFQAYNQDANRNLQAQGMDEGSRQFGANFGLSSLNASQDLINNQMQAGNVQRGIMSEGITADRQQFEQERDDPYKQVQFMQSLLQGLPIAAQNYSFMEPSNLSQFMEGGGGILSMFNQLFGNNSSTPAAGTPSGGTAT